MAFIGYCTGQVDFEVCDQRSSAAILIARLSRLLFERACQHVQSTKQKELQGIHSGFLRCSLAFRLMPNFANFEMWEAGVSQASAKVHESLRSLARSLSDSRELSAP